MMKKLYGILALLWFLGASSGCEKGVQIDEDDEIKVEFFSSEIISRVVGTQWNNGDEIGVFMDVEDEELRDVENVKYVNEMQDGENAVFKASNNSIYHPVAATASYRAYYPYKGDTNNKSTI